MNILFIGAFPPEFLVMRSGGKIDSLYRDDQAIIKGLRDCPDTNLGVITSPDIASWPTGPLYIRNETSYEEGLTMVGSLNISLLKQIWTIASMTYAASGFIRRCKSKVVVIIPYIVFRHVLTLRLLRFLHPNKVIQAVIVPDIFFPTNKLKKIINRITEGLAIKFDAFILYTHKMAEHLKVKESHFEVIEGFRDISDRTPSPSDEFKVVYAGSLNLNYGVGRLVEAMSLLSDSDIQLHLYGAGNAESLIKDKAKSNDNIIFHGKVSNAEATEAIYSASALINPRNSSDGDFTEYSFPSKDIEYMATGIPTLLCKLPGMPKEYYGHFIDLGDGSPNEIADSLLRVRRMPLEGRQLLGKDSRHFIIDRMDCSKQAARMVRLFKSVM